MFMASVKTDGEGKYCMGSSPFVEQNVGKVVSTPSVIAKDGGSAIVEFYDPEDAHHYKLELNATTSKETIEAAKTAATAGRH